MYIIIELIKIDIIINYYMLHVIAICHTFMLSRVSYMHINVT